MWRLLAVLCCSWAGLAGAGNGVSLSVVHTGNSVGNVEAMVVAGGSWLEWRKLTMTAVLIRHPKGDVLLDTGLGRKVDEHVADNSWLEKQLLKFENVKPAVTQLQQAGFNPQALHAIIPTHMHWDHVDALEDFIGVPVWVSYGAVDAARAGKRATFIQEEFDDPEINWQLLEFSDGPYSVFARSRDVFADGALVLVELSAHTVADIGAFVTLDSGRRYFFIGDLSWTEKGVLNNKPRPWIVNKLIKVDRDSAHLLTVLQTVHELQLTDPELRVVPAHDERVAKRMARYPEFEN